MKIGIFDHMSLRLGGGQLVLAWMASLLSRKYDVDVIHSGKGYTLSGLAAAFGVDLGRAKERIIGDSLKSFSIPGPQSMRNYLWAGSQFDRALTEPYDLFIYSGHGVPPFSFARKAIIYCHFPFEVRPRLAMQNSERWQRRHVMDRWIRSAMYEWVWDRRMSRYATVLANSYFTASWIERLWGIPADVVYPPVAVNVPPTEKRNLVVSLGRFISTDRKNHAHQLKAFPEFLCQVRGDWRFCIIGFCADLPQDRAYVEELRHMAKDLPVSFVVNAGREAVLSHLAEAKLLWHTTGLGDDGSTEPRYMEHFGMATVEAMMAGCVPLVPACGGQPEIVEHQVSGFLCHDLDTLVRYSVYLANDDHLCARLGGGAVERSMAFRPAIFEQRFGHWVQECLDELGRIEEHVVREPESSLSRP